MEDRELGELIKRSASRWRGPNGTAAGARFAGATRRRKLRYAAAFIGAAAALFMGASAMAGAPGPGSFLESILLGPSNHGSEGQPVATEPSPSISPEPKIVASQEPTPTSAQEPTPAPGHEPTPTPGHEPTPTPGHEPTPTPGHEPTPAPGHEPTPTPTAASH